ncbi:MAG: TetR/AcrR family transcriptional regulator [Stackebrandtia sp.]
MPKIVDREERRRQLARVVWRLIARDGLDAVSVRAVAREAGLSPGAVQYYFSDHKELLVFAMDVIVAVSGRRLAETGGADPRESLTSALAALAPLDQDAFIATRLWVEMFARSLTDPDFKRVNREFNDMLSQIIGELLTDIAAVYGVPAEAVALEAARLHALFDGACVHAATEPERMPPQRLRDILELHLDELTEKWRRSHA